MSWTRRRFLIATGGGLTALGLSIRVPAGRPVVIEMRGTARGERVWFDPPGLAVPPGTSVHFVNRDAANSHTATAYHPSVANRPRRIPAAAEPWDSGFLLPEETFTVRLDRPGVYDYYCVPHERGGMVGRLVVGTPQHPDWEGPADETDGIPDSAINALPALDAILAEGRVEAEV